VTVAKVVESPPPPTLLVSYIPEVAIGGVLAPLEKIGTIQLCWVGCSSLCAKYGYSIDPLGLEVYQLLAQSDKLLNSQNKFY